MNPERQAAIRAELLLEVDAHFAISGIGAPIGYGEQDVADDVDWIINEAVPQYRALSDLWTNPHLTPRQVAYGINRELTLMEERGELEL